MGGEDVTPRGREDTYETESVRVRAVHDVLRETPAGH